MEELAQSLHIRPHHMGFPAVAFFCLHVGILVSICLIWQQEHPFVCTPCLPAGIPAKEGLLGCSQTRVFLSQANMVLGGGVGKSGAQDADEQGLLPSKNF